MILECPKCEARFSVADAAIPEEGREVKCSKCANVWHATKELSAPVEEAAPAAMPTQAPKALEGDEDAGFPIDTKLSDESPAEKKEAEAQEESGDIDLVFEDKEAEEAFADEEPPAEAEGVEDTPVEEAVEEVAPLVEEPSEDMMDVAEHVEEIPDDELGEGDEEEEYDSNDKFDLNFDIEAVDFNYSYDKHEISGKKEKVDSNLLLYSISAVVLFIAIFSASLFAFKEQLQPMIPDFYEFLGMPRTDGLVLSDVEFRQRPEKGDNKSRFVVEGKIVNQAKQIRQVPIVRVALVDAEGEVIMSREYEADAELKPGEVYPFKASRLDTTFGNRVDHITVDLGNGAELMLRD